MSGKRSKSSASSSKQTKKQKTTNEENLNNENEENFSQISIPNAQRLRALTNQSNSIQSSGLNIYSEQINELKENLGKREFPAKIFTFGGVDKPYSPFYHFFDCRTHFDQRLGEKEKIKFICIFCQVTLNAHLGMNTNLYKHYTEKCPGFETFTAWKDAYDLSLDSDSRPNKTGI